MAFDTYANLQTSLLAWLNRASDSDAATRVTDWITLAEDEMRMALTRLKVRQGETVNSSFSISSEYTALPSGFIGLRSLRLNTNPVSSLDYVAPQQADRWNNAINVAGRPEFYTIQGNQIRVFPAPDSTYTGTIIYYTLPALSVSNTSNWLLAAHPKLYLNAALAEAYNYYNDQDKYAQFSQDRDRIISAIYTADGAEQLGSSMRIRIDASAP